MNDELHHIELESLVRMHQSASFRLQAALLSGSSWQEVKEQRELVTGLSIAIQQRRRIQGGHPAAAAGERGSGGGTGSPESIH